MNKKEVLELKRRFKKDAATFTQLVGCYVDCNHNKICKFGGKFLTLEEDEYYKYLEIANKVLSGTLGNNLLNLEFPREEEEVGGRQQILMALRDSKLEDETLLDTYYDLVIDTYDEAGNYLIQDDLVRQMEYFDSIGKELEAKRLKQRVEYDLEMIKEMGYCPGIENYSRYLDGRKEGQRPFCLIDYFPNDFITFIDESHVTIPQIRAMYGGDHSRKSVLIEYGFRLPAAADNRPLTFDEFESITGQTVYVSATPSEYELRKSEGLVVEQVVRPTGLLDPPIEVRPTQDQVDNLLEEIRKRAEVDERVLVTTLTKRMAEELDDFFGKRGVRCRYIHSDVDTAERVEIIEDFKNGLFDVLIGVNLLREGLDIPTVSLVAILDADKEGFLRSQVALTQTAGRAARNVHGLVIMYADSITKSMQETIYETDRRRAKQIEYNNITPENTKVTLLLPYTA